MSRQNSYQCGSDLSDGEKSLKQLTQELKSLKHWRMEETLFKEKEKEDKDRYIDILEEEMSWERERVKKNHKSRNHSRSSRTPTLVTHYEEESTLMNNFYQPPPPRPRREHREPRTIRVYLPHLYGKDDVEAYLDWEMEVEKTFAYHQVSEERNVPLTILRFQGNTVYWWATL